MFQNFLHAIYGLPGGRIVQSVFQAVSPLRVTAMRAAEAKLFDQAAAGSGGTLNAERGELSHASRHSSGKVSEAALLSSGRVKNKKVKSYG